MFSLIMSILTDASSPFGYSIYVSAFFDSVNVYLIVCLLILMSPLNIWLSLCLFIYYYLGIFPLVQPY